MSDRENKPSFYVARRTLFYTRRASMSHTRKSPQSSTKKMNKGIGNRHNSTLYQRRQDQVKTEAPSINRSPIMSSVYEILRSHCEDHQENRGDDRSLSVERRAAKIVEAIEEYGLATQMQRVALNRSDDECTFEREIANALIQFLECSLYSLVQTDNESKEAVKAVLELLATVSVCDHLICKPVIKHAVQLSETKLDSVRAAICQFAGWVVEKIMSLPTKKIARFNDVLDLASQMLLPRMTDKSQSVRLSAIKSSVHFFLDDATDPDILQSLLWCMQHDPSVANRVAATECVPINLETMDYVIQRIRDTKSKVRVAALQSIRTKCKDLSLLDATQCASLLQAGYTER